MFVVDAKFDAQAIEILNQLLMIANNWTRNGKKI